jgi:peroxiredoxin Q/BCP
MLKTGDTAPPFTLPDQNGKERSLADYAGSWVVLFVFSKADTSG